MSSHRIKGKMYMQGYSCVQRGKMCMCDKLYLPIQHHGQNNVPYNLTNLIYMRHQHMVHCIRY